MATHHYGLCLAFRPTVRSAALNIYVAGPMRGLPDFNFPAFRAATADLRWKGHTVYSPHENEPIGCRNDHRTHTGLEPEWQSGSKIRQALLSDTQYICTKADAIYLLPGWRESKGACAERALAEALGLLILGAK